MIQFPDFIMELENCWSYVAAAAAAAAALVLLVKRRQAAAAAERRAAWAAAGKDVVVLHMFDRSRTGINLSPFPIKVETYLRMAKIK